MTIRKSLWMLLLPGMLVFLIASCQLVGLPTTEADTSIQEPQVTSAPDNDRQLMRELSDDDPRTREGALNTVLARKDERFVPVFIELLRGAQIGIVPREQSYLDALEELSGQNFGGDWGAWVEWYGGTDMTPPEGFTGWKGAMLTAIDPRFADFLRDDAPSAIRVEEIQWGGVVVDGIPALDQPAHLPADAIDYLVDEEPVFGIEINGDARAYPLRIIDWHEMANDTVGGVPVSLAYCTLCGAAIAYDGRASDGNTYDFGSSGFLFRSNKLMYDRQTRTLWNQLTGEPVLGDLVGTGVKMELLPVVLTTWGEWKAQHPNTVALDIVTGFARPYELGSAYGDYFSADDTMFPVWQRSKQLDTKEQVYALTIDGMPVAYPITTVAEEQVVNDSVNGQNLVVVGQRGTVTVAGNSRRAGAVTYTAGSEIRAYDRGDREFSPSTQVDVLLDTDGNEWQVTESALVGPTGERAERVNGHLAYWFGWYSFYPQTLVYGAE